MSSITHHLVRRGVHHINNHLSEGHAHLEIPRWGATLLTATGISFVLLIVYVRYAYGELIATLAMVESPTAMAIVATPPYDDLDEKKEPAEQELLLVKAKPITSKICTTMRHLKSKGISRMRGFPIALLYTFFFHGLTGLFTSALPRNPIASSAIHLLVTVGLCRLAMLWTHTVISEKSDKRWHQRRADKQTARKIVKPTLVFAIAEQLGVMMPACAMHILRDIPMDRRMKVFVTLALGLAGMASFVFIVIPANVALTRVQASLLAEDETPVVPFDRTFGGLVVSEAEGGSGKLGMLVAWATFDWNSRVRLLKIYGKMFAVQVAIMIIAVFTLIAQLRIIIGEENFQKIVHSAANKVGHHRHLGCTGVRHIPGHRVHRMDALN